MAVGKPDVIRLPFFTIFCNVAFTLLTSAESLTTGNEEHAYKGIDAMFAHAYGICHVKAMEANDAGQVYKVDMAKTFAMLKAHNYKGYCSMEFDSPGDPYAGTQDLIATTLKFLA